MLGKNLKSFKRLIKFNSEKVTQLTNIKQIQNFCNTKRCNRLGSVLSKYLMG